MLHITQPLDMDPNFNKLLDHYGNGTIFSQEDAASVLNVHISSARKFLGEVASALADVPELPQLVIKRGSKKFGGGHRFVESQFD